MWQVLYIASTKAEAVEIEEKLKGEGFLVQIEMISKNEYQVKVLKSEAEDAYKYINDYFN